MTLIPADQTTDESLASLDTNPAASGTALYLLPAPEKGPDEISKVIVPDIQHDDSVIRSKHCL